VKRLRDRPQKQRVLVLLTDGVNTAGELTPAKAIDLAVANHVRIYTIGIGAEQMRVDSLFGSRVVNPSADLDEPMLTSMADKTGGRYFRARSSEDLADIYRSIDKLEPAADTKQSLRPIDEWYWLPLAAALAAAAFAFALPHWRVRFLRRIAPA
jgi:Ca-activated chloride channel homolog